MSYFSNAVFYRPDVAPIVKSTEVGLFLKKLQDLEFVSQSELAAAEINWGERVSEDVRPFYIEEDISSTIHRKPWWKRIFGHQPSIELTTTFSNIKPLEPDFTCNTSFDELIDQLMARDQAIGRLLINGSLTEDQCEHFQSPHPSGEEINFRPDSWSLEFGQIKLSRINGWEVEGMGLLSDIEVAEMAFSIGGYGYFYPWTFREWVERFTDDPELKQICELCRKTWPVEETIPSQELLKARRECEDLWPYEDIEGQLDWAWGPQEG